MTPEEVRLRAQHAAYTRWSKEDPAAQGRAGQAGLLAKFEAQVDPDGILPARERQRRAEAARKAHMRLLALRSSVSRRRAKAAREAAATVARRAAEAEAVAEAAEALEAECAGEDAASARPDA